MLQLASLAPGWWFSFSPTNGGFTRTHRRSGSRLRAAPTPQQIQKANQGQADNARGVKKKKTKGADAAIMAIIVPEAVLVMPGK